MVSINNDCKTTCEKIRCQLQRYDGPYVLHLLNLNLIYERSGRPWSFLTGCFTERNLHWTSRTSTMRDRTLPGPDVLPVHEPFLGYPDEQAPGPLGTSTTNQYVVTGRTSGLLCKVISVPSDTGYC